MSELEILHLNENQIEGVDFLNNMTSEKYLQVDLSRNLISSLPECSNGSKSKVGSLTLDFNQNIKFIDAESLSCFESLKNLSLSFNEFCFNTTLMSNLNQLTSIYLDETKVNGDLREMTEKVNLKYLSLMSEDCNRTTFSSFINLSNYAFDKENALSSNDNANIVYDTFSVITGCTSRLSEKTFCSRNPRKKVLIKNFLVSFDMTLENVCILGQMATNENKTLLDLKNFGGYDDYLVKYLMTKNFVITAFGREYLNNIDLSNFQNLTYCESKKFQCGNSNAGRISPQTASASTSSSFNFTNNNSATPESTDNFLSTSHNSSKRTTERNSQFIMVFIFIVVFAAVAFFLRLFHSEITRKVEEKNVQTVLK
jgi:hypothetical protein